MTDRAQPGAIDSVIRNDELGEAVSAFSEGGIVSGENPTNASIRRNDIDETVLDAFSLSTSSSSLDVTVAPGEAYVEGWFCRDTSTTITLPPNATSEIVVGYNTDAIFDPNVDADRDAADEVVVALKSNTDATIPQTVAHRVTTDGGGVTAAERVAPVGALSLRGLETPTLINGAGFKQPTTQLQSRGPLSANVNSERALFAEAPVNDSATAETESVLKMLESGLKPTMTVSRTLDGQGGAYGHQFDAPLGRFGRVNSTLNNFNHTDVNLISELDNWDVFDSGSTFTFETNSRPRRLSIKHDGSTSNHAGIKSSVLTTSESLDAFMITFHDVSVPDVSGTKLQIGISTEQPDKNIDGKGNGIFGRLFTSNNSIKPRVADNGTIVTDSGFQFDTSVNHDISFIYDGESAIFFLDGFLRSTIAYDNNADFTPVINVQDRGSDSNSGTVSVAEITVEPIGGAF
jgi:hypothetical protein